jgi:hypothetical protein
MRLLTLDEWSKIKIKVEAEVDNEEYILECHFLDQIREYLDLFGQLKSRPHSTI